MMRKIHKKVKQAFSIDKIMKFTQAIIFLLCIHYFINWLISVALIVVAIVMTGNFSYLDTLITETSITFRDIVGVAIIKFCLENIFKYNDFGGRVPSKKNECEIDDGDMPEDAENNIDKGGAKG